MNENPIAITLLNDFIFCPASIYFHSLEADEERLLFQDSYQLCGTDAHKHSDNGTYSSRAKVLQGISVYSERFNLYGKIDTFDTESGVLTERKKKIKTIYDGYVFQLYAQYFALIDMGYIVNEIRFYSMDDNKVYIEALPENNYEKYEAFIKLLSDIQIFSLNDFKQSNCLKCEKCIYEPLCSFSCLKGE